MADPGFFRMGPFNMEGVKNMFNYFPTHMKIKEFSSFPIQTIIFTPFGPIFLLNNVRDDRK